MTRTWLVLRAFLYGLFACLVFAFPGLVGVAIGYAFGASDLVPWVFMPYVILLCATFVTSVGVVVQGDDFDK